jgi:DEAD/DEAH box helicase domain-containing protein
LRIVLASLACLSEGLTVVVFGPTRMFAEEAARKARREAEKHGLDPAKIVPYRAGYQPEERRDIEEGLRNGKYQIVFSTNALEIGIDIGRLDVCILAGFPNSVLSAWQRIGRAGRTWDKHALVLFYALDNPVDQFYAENLDAFLNKPLDQITIGLENDQLINRHVPCLLYERKNPIEEKDKVILGECFYEKASKAQNGFQPVRGYSPHQQTPIRNVYSKSYRLIYKGHDIGTISGEQVQRETYIGAIYNHFGRPYRVESHGTDEISLVDADPNIRTEPITWPVVTESSVRAAHRYRKAVSWIYGDLTIYDNFGGYRVIDDKTGEVIGENKLDSPTATRRMVQGCWVTVETPEWKGLGNISSRLAVVRFLLHSGTPLTIPCDRFDIASLNRSEPPPVAYVYETVPGGIGIVEKLFDIWPEALKQGILIAENCSRHCKMGCPFCMHLDRFARSEDRSSKTEGIELASSLLQAYRDGPIEVFDPSTGTWRPE